MKLTSEQAAEWRLSWQVVVASALGLALMNGAVQTIGVFMLPLEAEFGWKRTVIASGLMFTATANVLLAPVIGMAVDRLGPRRIAIAGSVLVCIALALFSLVNASPWSWWAAWTLMAVCFVMVMPVVWTAAISSLFDSSRGLALAVALCGSVVSTALVPLYGTFLIAELGWRLAYVVLAGTFALLVVPPVIFMFTSAIDRTRTRKVAAAGQGEQPPILPGLPARQALRSSKFTRLVLGSCAYVTVSAVTNTFIPIVTSLGHSVAAAAGITSLIGVSAAAGRLFGGYLLDRLNGNMVAGTCMVMPAIAIALMLGLPESVAALCAAAVIMGSSMGAEFDAVAYLVTRHFGLRSFGILLAVTSGVQAIVLALAPMGLNYVYDVTGSYHSGLMVVIPVCLVGAILLFTLGRYGEFGEARGH
ncbi:MAG TPA: MFS transporter [Novosphingobium sp.]|nr:MFS transporter [Novosphingobium sp.]